MIKRFIQGFIIGLGKIIPGVSGTLFACLFGVYNTIIECISNPKLIIKNKNIIIPISIGIVFALIFGSSIISVFLSNYYVESMSLFIGMMSYGIIDVIKTSMNASLKRSEVRILFILIIIMSMLLFIEFDSNVIIGENIVREYISLFLCGILDAFSTIVPGISGTALLMIVGYYNIVINAIANINLYVLFPFIIGFIIGIIFIAKLINYLFKHHEGITNISILVFASFSIMSLLLNMFKYININNIIYVLLLFIIGVIISYLIDKIK